VGIKEIIRNTGRGSWFGYGRIFGVHYPLDSNLSKAIDPFINLRTLARLSFSKDPEILQAVECNLFARLRHKMPPKDFVYILTSFNTEVLIPEQIQEIAKEITDLIVRRAIVNHPKTNKSTLLELARDRNVGMRAFERLDSLRNRITGQELDGIARETASNAVIKAILHHPFIWRDTLLYLVGNPNVCGQAFDLLSANLSIEKLDYLSLSTHSVILERVARHENSFPEAVARAISGFSHKSSEVTEIIDMGEGKQYSYVNRFYGETAANNAVEIINLHKDPQKQKQILAELEKINPELANLVIAKFSEK